MQITPLLIPEILAIQPIKHEDKRGFFSEYYRHNFFEKLIKKKIHFVQQNFSSSVKSTLRGLHYQLKPYAQSKLVWVTYGEIFDVVVDIRRSSPTYGKYVSIFLSCENQKQLWIPEGFAHGFLVLSDKANVFYQTTQYYNPSYERTIIWNDPEINIQWPNISNVLISPKDASGIRLITSETFP